MRTAIPPLPNTPSWRGDRTKVAGQFYLFNFIIETHGTFLTFEKQYTFILRIY
jgi:hypothetical protein